MFNLPFSIFENTCTKSGIWQLVSIRLMCFIIWFCHLIRNFPFWIFLGAQYFCNFIICCISYVFRSFFWTQIIPIAANFYVILVSCLIGNNTTSFWNGKDSTIIPDRKLTSSGLFVVVLWLPLYWHYLFLKYKNEKSRDKMYRWVDS